MLRGLGGRQLALECLCGHVNLAEALEEKIRSTMPLSLRDCTSQFSLGGIYVSAEFHLLSKDRISTEFTTVCVFSLEKLKFYLYSHLFQSLTFFISRWHPSLYIKLLSNSIYKNISQNCPNVLYQYSVCVNAALHSSVSRNYNVAFQYTCSGFAKID